MMLRGNAPATIDEKGRLKVPSGFRAVIDESWGSDFYVTSLSGESVLIYPLPVWQEIEERLAKIPSLNPTKKKFLDRTNYYGQLASADKSGRILIPQMLRESAEMTGEVAVLGSLDHLEVWNHKRFVARIKEHEFTEQDQETLSQLGI
jgi:MraZ protein